VLTPRLFEQPRNGGELCTERLLRELESVGHRLLVIGRGDAGPQRSGRDYVSVGPGVRAFDTLGRGRRAALVLKALVSNQASTVQRLAEAGAARKAGVELAAAAAEGIDCLVVDHLQVLGWLDHCERPLPRPLLVMHNVESEVQFGQAGTASGSGLGLARRGFRLREARLLRELEKAAMGRAAAVACLSEADAVALQSLGRTVGASPHIAVLPGYPLSVFSMPIAGACGGRPSALRRIGMIGTWTWAPNRTALTWMLEQVLPRLPLDCTLLLAGTGLDGAVLPPRVQLLGAVDHPQRLYEAVDVVAVPSITGSGVQEKAIEAIASGRPVVATRHALRGLSDALPGHVHVADSAEEFAHRCAVSGLHLSADTEQAVNAWAATSRLRYAQALEGCVAASRARRSGLCGGTSSS
jgi:polysaccharide biosynthesis protein PslH